MKQAFRVRDFMRTDLLIVRDDWPIMRAVTEFLEHRVSGSPVLDGADNLVGILTERDCMRVALDASYFDEPGGQVRDFMSSPVITVDPNDSLIDIAEQFRDTSFRRFPVVSAGRMVGLISRRDVLSALKHGVWFTPR